MMPDRIRTALEFLQRYTLGDAGAEPGSARQSIRRYTIAGVALVAFLTLGVGVWATTVEIAGALIAPGTVVVESNIKKVQHPTGGVVGELRVKDGDRVKAADLLVRLDDTITRANLAIVTKTLTELTARKARLSAERDGSESITFPEELLREVDVPDVALVMAAEMKLFDLRRSARAGQKSQLRERINQANEEIVGFGSQKAAKDKEIGFIEHELTGVRDLYQKNLVPITRLNALERDAASIEGQRGQLIASVAQAESRIAETQFQIIQIDEQMRAEAMQELREIQGKIAEYTERRVAAEDQLKRIDIRAPSDGYVHQLNVHTIGGVISPAEPVMNIVPINDKLELEAKVLPHEIDQVKLGQKSTVKVHAANARMVPDLHGTVSRISADVSRDQQTGTTFYTIRIALPQDEIKKLENIHLIAGMQAEVFVEVNQRTPFEYFFKPMQEQIARAFREH